VRGSAEGGGPSEAGAGTGADPGTGTGAALLVARFVDEPAEQRVSAGGRVVADVVYLGGMPVIRTSHAPGWRWSEHSRPEAGSDRCQNTHVGVMLSGRMEIEAADGSRAEVGPGDVVLIRPGHDAWTLGSEPAVLLQLDEGASAARRFGQPGEPA
jgi:quercetin dioxygenase-like cupin family protein